MSNDLRKEIQKKANKKKAKNLQGFFKTGKGEYGEGDLFLGVVVPELRKIAAKYKHLAVSDLGKCISSKFHEERLTTLLILVEKFKELSFDAAQDKLKIYNFYLENRKYINSWDLVDLTAPAIVGGYLFSRWPLGSAQGTNFPILIKLARSKNLWDRRIAMLSTFYYIQRGDCKDALKIAKILKNDEQDLIQKAVGWMLREVGKRCGQKIEEEFLEKNYKTMPRTMLRYAIERFSEKKRKKWLF